MSDSRVFRLQLFLSRYGFIKSAIWEETQFEGSASALSEDFLDDLGDTIEEATSLHHSRNSVGESDLDHPDSASRAFASALEEFQKVSGLPVTGLFDEATKEAMNKPRCGVPDKEVDWNAAPEPESSPSGSENGTSGAFFNETDSDDTATNSSVTAQPLKDETYNLNNSTDFNLQGSANDKDVDGRRKRRQAGLISKNRQRRGASEHGYVAFSKRLLKWRLIGEGYSSQLTVEEQSYIFRLAFRMWSEVSPLEFVEDTRSPLGDVDIRLGFGTGTPLRSHGGFFSNDIEKSTSNVAAHRTGRHLGCNQRFDGTGQEFAHAWFLGDIHFDDDEHFTAPNAGSGISLLKVGINRHTVWNVNIRRFFGPSVILIKFSLF